MFTESVRVACNFPACWGGSAKYQTCLKQKQETTICTAFCNYLASEVEELEGKDHTFRNEAVKPFSNNQSKSEERGHQTQQPQQQTLS